MRRTEMQVERVSTTRIEFDSTSRFGEGSVIYLTRLVTSTYEDGSVKSEYSYAKEDNRRYQTMGRMYNEFAHKTSMNASMKRTIKEDGFVTFKNS